MQQKIIKKKTWKLIDEEEKLKHTEVICFCILVFAGLIGTIITRDLNTFYLGLLFAIILKTMCLMFRSGL